MTEAVRAAAVVSAGVLMTCGLLAVQPFLWVNRALDAVFGATPEWTQVRTLSKNPLYHEVTSGEHPRRVFKNLEQAWASAGKRPRVLFVGNSQMQTMSLAPGEERPHPQELTYFDHVNLELSASSKKPLFFRLSAGGLNYQEALWNLEYFLQSPDLKPDLIVWQLNYQAFGLSGVRDGLTELLQDASFQQRIEYLANQNKAFSDIYLEALQRFRRTADSAPAGTASSSSELPATNLSWASRFEESTRGLLSHSPIFRSRADQRERFIDTLYRFRLYVLRITPSTARRIGVGALRRSESAVEEALDHCRELGIRVELVIAPTNPQVQLLPTPDDKRKYKSYIHELANRFGTGLIDLEDGVPSPLWGRYYNIPDPLHMGREAHRKVAQVLIPIVRKDLGE